METRCLIIDDEPPARELLASYISRLDDFKICGRFGNAMDAFNFIQKNEVDLLFVDIHMPRMNGLELIKGLIHRPKTIITTAYREYAAEGFDLEILDYLVKPIVFDRFLKSITRYNHTVMQEQQPNTSFNEAYMFFRVEKEMVKIYLKDIHYIESIQDYIKIVTLKKTYITYIRIGFMEEKLPEGHFVRIHKSFIIPIHLVESFTHNSVKVSGHQLPLGRVFKQGFINMLGGYNAAQTDKLN